MKPIADSSTVALQRKAADPTLSAWVSANAGSGKTKVLVDRVLRLMLAGAEPSRILCLTFTKAAAANMAVRVFDELGKWVTLDDASLVASLQNLEGEAPSRQRLSRARRLFAEAIETPGGLKIETIHAFCERVLHIAPFEANVPANFQVLDDLENDIIRAEARRRAILEAIAAPGSVTGAALARVAVDASDDGLDELLATTLQNNRELLRRLVADPEEQRSVTAQVERAMNLTPSDTLASIEADILAGPFLDASAIGQELMQSPGGKDRKCGAAFLDAVAAPPSRRADLFAGAFLRADGEPYKDGFITSAVRTELRDRLLAERDRVARLMAKRAARHQADRSIALLTLAGAVQYHVDAIKQSRGALDFADLIERTATLLESPSAGWVLQKLDQGVDHLLVDEAQDTNATQWRILEAVTADFFAGEGQRQATGLPRTVFAVGDPKQSIYGFQGAEPRLFDVTGTAWRRRVINAGGSFERIQLRRSFRSSPAVLTAVDRVFGIAAHFAGLSFAEGETRTEHESAREKAPGVVEVWQPLTREASGEDNPWDPVDAPGEDHPMVRNAQRIARTIKHWTTNDGIATGEIIVLMRKRGAAFDAVIRELKTQNVNVAGADRLALLAQIGVQDLLAVGRAALQPLDDLTLATALKSPFVRWTDDDLMRIAAPRPDTMTLAEAIDRSAAEGDEVALRAKDALSRWRSLAQHHGPFGFYASLLGPQGGRLDVVGRLGAEAADAIDALLARAFSYERTRIPSLASFLADIEKSEEEVKREMEAQADKVRVMTVHAAKGLEATAVILADDCDDSRPSGRSPPLLPLSLPSGVGLPIWAGRESTDPPVVANARQTRRQDAEHEHNRLLYVALTRAKDRLAIAPILKGNLKSPKTASWTEMVRSSLHGEAEVERDPLVGPKHVWRHRGDVTDPERSPAAGTRYPLPPWLWQSVALEAEQAPPLRPSARSAADAGDRSDEPPSARRARLVGTVTHMLLQHLPSCRPDLREQTAKAIVVAHLPSMNHDEQEQVIQTALSVVADPSLAPVFSPAARAEVPIGGLVEIAGQWHAVSGQADRLAILPDRVVIADFKTTARPPKRVSAIPQAHVDQLAIYSLVLEQAFPGRAVQAALVYTTSGTVFIVPPQQLAVSVAILQTRLAA